jgi:hypothetical protein
MDSPLTILLGLSLPLVAMAQIEGVRITRPDSPEFPALLHSFPGQVPVEFEAVLPYSYILENTSDLPIASIVTRVYFTNAGGKQVFSQNHTHYRGDDPARVLQPGRKRFVSPDPTVNMIVNSGRQMPAELQIQHAEILRERISKLGDGRPVIDSVIFADGELQGPDQFRVVDMFSEYDRAEQDLLRELRARRSAPRPAIKDYLKQASQPAGEVSPEKDHYQWHRSRVAEDLMNQMDQDASRDVVAGYEKQLSKVRVRKVARRQK